MKNNFLILIAFLLLVSCSGPVVTREENKGTGSVELTQPKVDSNFINPALKEIISNYIKDVDGNFLDKEWLYYNLFFFTEERKMHFTIWTFTTYPSLQLSKEYEEIKYKHSLCTISDRKIVFIYPYSQEFKDLFVFADQTLNDAKIEKEKPYEGLIYDGDWYFKTFEATQINGEWKFNKIDKANVKFLRSQPPNSYLH